MQSTFSGLPVLARNLFAGGLEMKPLTSLKFLFSYQLTYILEIIEKVAPDRSIPCTSEVRVLYHSLTPALATISSTHSPILPGR